MRGVLFVFLYVYLLAIRGKQKVTQPISVTNRVEQECAGGRMPDFREPKRKADIKLKSSDALESALADDFALESDNGDWAPSSGAGDNSSSYLLSSASNSDLSPASQNPSAAQCPSEAIISDLVPAANERASRGKKLLVVAAVLTIPPILLLVLAVSLVKSVPDSTYQVLFMAGALGSVLGTPLGTFALMEGAHNIATASLWARRASWLHTNVASRRMKVTKVSNKKDLLQICDGEKFILTVRVLKISNQIHSLSAFQTGDYEVKCDLFPHGAGVVYIGGTPVWCEVTELRSIVGSDFKEGMKLVANTRTMGQVRRFSQFAWFLVIVSLVLPLLLLWMEPEVIFDFGAVIFALLNLGMVVSFINSEEISRWFLRRYVNVESPLIIKIGSLTVLANHALIRNRQPEMDQYNQILRETADLSIGERTARIVSMLSAMTLGKPEFSALKKQAAIGAVLLLGLFSAVQVVARVQPVLLREYPASPSHYLTIGESAEITKETLVNAGRDSVGIRVTAAGTALSTNLVEHPSVTLVLQRQSGEPTRETRPLTRQADGTWKVEIADYKIPHSDFGFNIPKGPTLEVDFRAMPTRAGTGSVTTTVEIFEKTPLPIGGAPFTFTQNVEVSAPYQDEEKPIVKPPVKKRYPRSIILGTASRNRLCGCVLALVSMDRQDLGCRLFLRAEL